MLRDSTRGSHLWDHPRQRLSDVVRRAGTIAAILLADFGHEKKEAMDLVRERRKGAIETKVQEEFILNYNIYK